MNYDAFSIRIYFQKKKKKKKTFAIVFILFYHNFFLIIQKHPAHGFGKNGVWKIALCFVCSIQRKWSDIPFTPVRNKIVFLVNDEVTAACPCFRIALFTQKFISMFYRNNTDPHFLRQGALRRKTAAILVGTDDDLLF